MMSTDSGLSVMVGTGLVGWALCYPVIWLLRKLDMWDRPNQRSSHAEPVLCGGGLAPLVILIGLIFVLVFPDNVKLGIAWMAGLILLAIISFLDDKKNGVSIKLRLTAQTVSVAGIVYVLFAEDLTLPGLFFMTFTLVGMVNFINFMDGINGLVSGFLIITVLGSSVTFGGVTPETMIAPFCVGLGFSGALLGFMPFNFPKAKMFLGDVGSVCLGFSCCVFLLWLAASSNGNLFDSLLMGWMVLSYFFMEGVITLGRRIWRREKWWEPHREHFYQRLVRIGWSHERTASTIWGLQCLVMVLAGWRLRSGGSIGVWCLVPVLAWSVFFLYVESVFRRAFRNLPN